MHFSVRKITHNMYGTQNIACKKFERPVSGAHDADEDALGHLAAQQAAQLAAAHLAARHYGYELCFGAVYEVGCL